MKKHQDKRKEAECSKCPLDGNNKVYGIHLGEDSRIVFIGEAPGSEEDRQGEPFVGPAGFQLKKAIGYTRISFAFAHKMNCLNCRPPSNKITSSEAEIALERCKKGFKEELKRVIEQGAKVIVPLGNTAMKQLEIEGSITKNRGSVFISPLVTKLVPKKIIPIIPTFHPSYILRGQIREVPTWIQDLKKAWDLTKKDYKPPKERFTIFPSLPDIVRFKNKVIENKTLLGTDIETIGLDPFQKSGEIIMIGFATSESDAIVIPFLKQNKDPYWNMEEERIVKGIIKAIIKNCPLIFQNAMFDAYWLAEKIGPCREIKHDVMIAHHSLSPELPHNLGYITSVYGTTPYWKDLDLKGEKAIYGLRDEDFRTYNARDCVVLHQILPDILKDLREDNLIETYNIGMSLIPPLIEMQRNGIPIDEDKLKKYRTSLKRKITIAKKKINEVANLPEAFNLNSQDDKRYLFFGIIPQKCKRAIEELKEYDKKDSKKSKQTKKYKKLIEDKSILESIEPFPLKLEYTRKTESGNIKVDDETLQNLYKGCFKRIDEIDNMKKQRASHKKEKEQLKREIELLKNLMNYAKLEKEYSTYTKFFIKDGAVHPKYKIHGTNTSRLASSSPNGQNIPKSAKKVFVAPKNRTFIQADYSNLELRVLAYISKDKNLLKIFEQGLNVHSENCKAMFGLDENDPMWPIARHACKTYQFGRNYGGTLKGIYARVINQVPELNLSFHKFQDIDKQYKQEHPEQDRWSKKVQKIAKTERISVNAFGRKRYLLGTYSEMEREALNSPIQSTAADIMNKALIEVYNDKKLNKLDILLHGTVHDSLLVSCPEDTVKKAVLFLKEKMEIKTKINGYDCNFPVDFEVGKSWGELQKYEL